MYIIASLVVILLSILLYFIKKHLYIRKCLSKFPGPPNVLFFGCALEFLGDKGMLAVFEENRKKYGDIFYARIGPNVNTLIFCDPELTKAIFTANINLSKGANYDHTKCWLGKGLLTTSEEKWKQQRRMITPAFNSQLLANFIATFDKQSQILLEKITQITPTKSVEIHSLTSLCSLDIICETSMGVSMNAQKNQNVEYVKSVKEMCKIIANRSQSTWKSNNLLFKLSQDYRIQRKCLKILHDFTDLVISERKKQRCNNEKKDVKKFALLDILLDYSENEHRLTEEEIRQEVHTFMFAGHDTVTTAMDFFIYEISKHHKIQEALYEEQKNIFGDDINRKTTIADVHEMRYLDVVIKETLRLYPPVPVYTRQVTKEFIHDGKIIPEGTILIHFSYGLHRNENIHTNPLDFDPSRFENSDAKLSQAYLPFSTGPRNCIGQKFAMYEMKVVLSKLLRNLQFWPSEPEHKLDIRAEVVLLSRTGVKVKITQREI